MKTKLLQQEIKLQNKAIRIINFLPFIINKKFLNCKILYRYKAVKDCFEKKIPNSFINCSQNSGSQHSHRTCSAFKNCPFVPNANTYIYGKKFIKYQCIDTWNKYQKEFKIDLLNGRRPDVRKLLTESFLQSYLER